MSKTDTMEITQPADKWLDGLTGASNEEMMVEFERACGDGRLMYEGITGEVALTDEARGPVVIGGVLRNVHI